MGTAEMQLAVLNLLMDELPLCNRLLLGWLLNHMSHIAEKVRIRWREEIGREESGRERNKDRGKGDNRKLRERNEERGKGDNREWEGEREQLKFLVLFHDRLMLTRWVYQI